MLILKLVLVPLAILILGIVERTHGPRLAGWLAGFPVIAAPLLLFIALDHGTAFGSAAALGAYFGLVPWLAFTLSYAAVAARRNWLWCTVVGFAAWGLVAALSMFLPAGPRWLELIPLAAFVAALFAYPRGEASDEAREHNGWGLPLRMLAGAALTIAVTQLAATLGSGWSGQLTTFPVMGSIITISSHVQYGRHAAREAVAGMTMGLASVGSFCFAAYALLGAFGVWPALGLSLLVSSSAHALTWLLFKHRA